jgi:DNA-binding CsgD family transcriptional regulator
MTREQKIEAFTMRLNGCTLQEIGDKFGITREGVRVMFSTVACKEANIRKSTENVKYRNLSNWMRTNDVGMGELWVKMGNKPANSGTTKISKLLKGDNSLGLRMSQIQKILQITGMTFEEAFATKEDEQ